MQMLKAVILAQIALYIAVLVPGVSDKILGLRGLDIGLWGWAVSLIGPVATLILCELAKIITHYQVRRYQRKLLEKRDLEKATSQIAPEKVTVPAVAHRTVDI